METKGSHCCLFLIKRKEKGGELVKFQRISVSCVYYFRNRIRGRPRLPEEARTTWKHLEAWHRSRRAAVARSDQPSPRGAVHLAAAEHKRERAVDREAPAMDPSDVEMESAEHPPQPQQPPPPAPPQPAAAGDGWSMLSRARGLLQEGQPSLALQAVRTLASLSLPSHPLFPSASISCASSRLSTLAVRVGTGNPRGPHPPEPDHAIRTDAVGFLWFQFRFGSSSPWRNPPWDFARSDKTGVRCYNSF